VNLWVRLLLAVVAGFLLAAAFPPFGASILAPLAVAVMTSIVWQQRLIVSAVLGAVVGVIFFGILLRWVALVGTDAWVALSVFCALWFAVLAAASALLSRLPFAPVWIASAWVAQEALRDRIPLGGFPWGRLAYAQTATSLTPWAAIGGAAFVTFLTALAGASIAYAVLHWTSDRRRDAVLALGGVFIIALSGLAIPRSVEGQDAGGPPYSVAAVIQGGVPNTGLPVADERREVLRRHVATTVELADFVARGEAEQPDFVIWPENSTDIDPLTNVDVAQQISTAAEAIGVPILVGAVLGISETEVANVGIVWDPVTGPGEIYIKQRPVPFGEYVPFRPLLTRIIGRFDQVPRDFIAGDTSGVLQVGDALVGDVICFEVAYDDVVRNAVRDGGRILAVQTNNATFAGLGQPEQQIAMSRLRAVETSRTVLVAATSGISAILDPAGGLVQELGEEQTGWMVSRVALRDDLTPAVRFGEFIEIILSLAAGAALVWSVTGHQRRRGRPGRPRSLASDVG